MTHKEQREGYRFGVGTAQHSTKSILRGTCMKDKRFLKVWVSHDWSTRQTINQVYLVRIGESWSRQLGTLAVTVKGSSCLALVFLSWTLQKGDLLS